MPASKVTSAAVSKPTHKAQDMQNRIETLFSEGKSILFQIQQAERRIACKRLAEQQGMEARFYPDPYSAYSVLLTEPLSFYEEALAQLQQEKNKTAAALKDTLNAVDPRPHDLRKSM